MDDMFYLDGEKEILLNKLFLSSKFLITLNFSAFFLQFITKLIKKI